MQESIEQVREEAQREQGGPSGGGKAPSTPDPMNDPSDGDGFSLPTPSVKTVVVAVVVVAVVVLVWKARQGGDGDGGEAMRRVAEGEADPESADVGGIEVPQDHNDPLKADSAVLHELAARGKTEGDGGGE